uniref:Uncharacterized protein n=1 Tax=Mycena chlorophos TaxID=658473 RepID=A0ABQ0LZC9_MYCCL|nr:predicted protein [Mycena chlorophos]
MDINEGPAISCWQVSRECGSDSEMQVDEVVVQEAQMTDEVPKWVLDENEEAALKGNAKLEIHAAEGLKAEHRAMNYIAKR